MSDYNRRKFLKTAMVAGAAMSGAATQVDAGFGFNFKNQTAVGLTAEKIENVRIGVIGVGNRGSGAVRRLAKVPGCEITAICDIRVNKAEAAKASIKDVYPDVELFTKGPDDYKTLCELDKVDLVYICTPWEWHTPMAVYAMKSDKHAATEVPAAITLDECWQLVNVSEKTQKHCMMLENVCYGEPELNVLNMCRNNVFGELTHGEAAYIHDLRKLHFGTHYQDKWRLKHHVARDGNLYPTHGLGPVAQYMNINRGDRFDHLVSMSSQEAGLRAYAKDTLGADSDYANKTYKHGDMNTTIVKTAKGRTIMIQHDVTSPRPYSRHNLISGTKGTYAGFPDRIAIGKNTHKWDADLLKEYKVTFAHPLWKQLQDRAKKDGGHGGMDYIMDFRLIHCLNNGLPLDQDVYDAASWSSIFPLTAKSIDKRSSSVDVPDFTRGLWKTTAPLGIVTV